MSDNTGITWTSLPWVGRGATWNPVTGCSKVSAACKHCYAERDWKRLSANSKAKKYYGRKFNDVQCHPDVLDQPLRWTKPRGIFVNSMSDLFHEDVPFEFIASVFAVMSVTTRHTYMVLTKRPQRMVEFFEWASDGNAVGSFGVAFKIAEHWPEHIPWKGYDNCGPLFPYENVWLGVTVESQEAADERIPLLLQTPAAKRFVSCEPLLGEVDLTSYGLLPLSLPAYQFLHWLDWVIVGGESGPKARPMILGHAKEIVRQCHEANTPVFVKQLGAKPTNREGQPHQISDRKGAIMDEWPEGLRVQQFPSEV